MNSVDERNVDPVQEIVKLTQNLLNLSDWGFRESYRSNEPGTLIYDSEWCRLKISWDGWDYLGGNTINMFYGRLHAPNQKATMVWQGEECYCWHDIDYQLHFLDGQTPADAAKTKFSHPVKASFYDSDFRKKFSRRQPEWLATMHMTIWKHYGTRFFELFDLRRSDLWQQYRQFLKEVYEITGGLDIEPSLEKVC